MRTALDQLRFLRDQQKHAVEVFTREITILQAKIEVATAIRSQLDDYLDTYTREVSTPPVAPDANEDGTITRAFSTRTAGGER